MTRQFLINIRLRENLGDFYQHLNIFGEYVCILYFLTEDIYASYIFFFQKVSLVKGVSDLHYQSTERNEVSIRGGVPHVWVGGF